jgi:hypothetical protein
MLPDAEHPESLGADGCIPCSEATTATLTAAQGEKSTGAINTVHRLIASHGNGQ